jgi:hypothetical protein
MMMVVVTIAESAWMTSAWRCARDGRGMRAAWTTAWCEIVSVTWRAARGVVVVGRGVDRHRDLDSRLAALAG